MEEMSVLLPGFNVKFRFELTEDDIESGKKIGVPPAVLDISKVGRFNIYNTTNIGSTLGKWVHYPLPLVLIDKFIIDKETLGDILDRSRILWDSSGDTVLAKSALEMLHKESRVFEVYSSDEILEKNKREFQTILFSLASDEQTAKRIKYVTSRLNRSYGEMVVPPWLFESFCLAKELLVQKTMSSQSVSIPLLTSDSDKELFFAALPYNYSYIFMEEFRVRNEKVIREFIDVLPMVYQKLHVLPLSANSRDPRKIADKILELRNDDEIKEVRKNLFNIYRSVRDYNPKEEEVALEVAKEVQEKRDTLSSLNWRIPFEVIAGTATGAVSIISNWQLGLCLLPFIIAGTYWSVEKDIKERERIRWVGFFEKFL